MPRTPSYSLLTKPQSIAQNAFQGHARAYTPFHPIKTAGYATEYSVDVPQATELLELAGFSKINDDGIRYSGWVNTLTLTLAVNADNPFKTAAAEQIASDLLKAGIKVNIRALKSAEFLNAVADGTYDMYLAEIRLAPNMTLSPLLSSSGAAAQGMVTAPKGTAAYSEYLEGKTDLTQFVSAFYEDTPFVPLCYRTWIIAYTRSFKVAQRGRSEDVFTGIENLEFLIFSLILSLPRTQILCIIEYSAQSQFARCKEAAYYDST
jgi:peptide/nickel transport system substrate-binding protein